MAAGDHFAGSAKHYQQEPKPGDVMNRLRLDFADGKENYHHICPARGFTLNSLLRRNSSKEI